MRFPLAKSTPQTPDEAAVWWATRRHLEPGRASDEQAFTEWLADPDNAAAWEELERRVDLIDSFAAMPEVRAMRRAALEVGRAHAQRPKPRWMVGTAIAASIAGASLWLAVPDQATSPIASAESVRRYATAVGQRRDVLLSDGSKVTLNTDSLVEVRYSSERRDVRLVQGQALFQVAKNPDRPFVVTAADRQVTAVGTAFDVRLRENGMLQVLLIEGRVHVDPVQRTGLERIMPALARTDLTAGQQLVRDRGDTMVEAADVERETAWNRGVLIFQDDSVADVVKEVNRYSPARLQIEDQSLGRLKVSGIFPTANPQDFVAALQTLYPVEARAEQGGPIRLRWRQTPAAADE